MKVCELRAFMKERRVRGFSTMKKEELEERVRELKKAEEKKKYEEELKRRAVCSACLREQRIQRKIDEKEHDQRLLQCSIRRLICEHCRHANFAYDGDETLCVDCGAVQEPNVDYDRRS